MTHQWFADHRVPAIASQWISIALGSPRPFGLHFVQASSLRSVRYPDGPAKGWKAKP